MLLWFLESVENCSVLKMNLKSSSGSDEPGSCMSGSEEGWFPVAVYSWKMQASGSCSLHGTNLDWKYFCETVAFKS